MLLCIYCMLTCSTSYNMSVLCPQAASFCWVKFNLFIHNPWQEFLDGTHSSKGSLHFLKRGTLSSYITLTLTSLQLPLCSVASNQTAAYPSARTISSPKEGECNRYPPVVVSWWKLGAFQVLVAKPIQTVIWQLSGFRRCEIHPFLFFAWERDLKLPLALMR